MLGRASEVIAMPGVQLNPCLSAILLESIDQVKVADCCSSRFDPSTRHDTVNIWDTHTTTFIFIFSVHCVNW